MRLQTNERSRRVSSSTAQVCFAIQKIGNVFRRLRATNAIIMAEDGQRHAARRVSVLYIRMLFFKDEESSDEEAEQGRDADAAEARLNQRHHDDAAEYEGEDEDRGDVLERERIIEVLFIVLAIFHFRMNSNMFRVTAK